MNYFSTYLWEKADKGELSKVSLILQQAQVRKKTLLLACVCEGKNEGEIGVTESGYFTEGLVEWFHKEGLEISERKRAKEELGKALQKEVGRLKKEIAHYTAKNGQEEKLHYWGVLLWENAFWAFAKGDCTGFLLNRRYQKKHMRSIVEEGEKGENSWISGRLQKRLGILLCNSEFLRKLQKEEIVEVLIPNDEISEERMTKRLKELWTESVNRGVVLPVGAIYLRI